MLKGPICESHLEQYLAHSNCYLCAYAQSLQSCPTLCDPMDCSLAGSSVYGIFQARVLEWGAIAFFKKRGIRGQN